MPPMLSLCLATSPDVFGLPPQYQSLLAVGMWMLIAAGVIGSAAAAVSMWSNLRRKPSIEATFATKHELAATEQRLSDALTKAIGDVHNQQRAIFSKLDATNATLNEHAREMEGAVGRLEGEMKGMAAVAAAVAGSKKTH